jgi:hypothetical protein
MSEAAEKGSQKWIQKLVDEKPELLNLQIRRNLELSEDEEIQWLSPLKSDRYAEYRDRAFINLFDVELKQTPLGQFWPRGGPQWDALGKSSLEKLFLVEAKSHISELISTSKAENENSVKRIAKSLEETKHYLSSETGFDWSSGFYQYANRLAHLYLLRKNQLPAYLVFVYFVNDLEMRGPTTIYEWKGAIALLHSYLGIRRHKLQKFISEIFIDVNDLNNVDARNHR